MSGILLLALLAHPAAAQDTDDGDPAPDDADEEVVVTGSRTAKALSESVVVTDVVTREEIEDSGAQDLSEVLETEPGVEIRRSFRGAAVRMQGLDSEYVLVLVDGKRLVGRRDGVVDLSRIPVERIERIEIVKGAASALYGSEAIAGVINIITREPEGPLSTRTHASYGSRNTLDASLHGGFDRGDLAATAQAGWHMTDGYDWDPSDLQTDGNRVREGTGDASGTWKPTPSLALEAAGSYRLRDSRGVDEAGLAVYDRHNLAEEITGRLGSRVLVGDRGQVRASLQGSTLRDQYVLDQRGSDALDTYEDARESLVQLDAQGDVAWDRQVVSLGVEALLEHLRSPRLSREGERWRVAVFAQDEVQLGRDEQLVVVPSGRLDLDSWFGTHATPRLAVRWDPVEDLALRASGGQGFRAPSFREMFLHFENPSAGYVVDGNPDLQPETSFSLSAGVQYSPADLVDLRVDAFRNRLCDMIDFGQVPDPEHPGDWTYLNIAEAETRGVEASVRARLSWLSLHLGYTWTWTRNLDLDRPLEGRAPHRGTVGLVGRHDDWGLDGTVRAEAVGPASYWFDVDGDGVEDPTETDPYLLLKLRLEKSVLPRRLRVFAGADNLLDAGDALYVHLDPRTFYAGLTFDHPVPGDER